MKNILEKQKDAPTVLNTTIISVVGILIVLGIVLCNSDLVSNLSDGNDENKNKIKIYPTFNKDFSITFSSELDLVVSIEEGTDFLIHRIKGDNVEAVIYTGYDDSEFRYKVKTSSEKIGDQIATCVEYPHKGKVSGKYGAQITIDDFLFNRNKIYKGYRLDVEISSHSKRVRSQLYKDLLNMRIQ